MARPSKIEKHGLQDKVIALRNEGESYNAIARIVKQEDNVKISDMAVKRFMDKYEEKVDEKAVEVIKEDKRRVAKSVNYTYDIIQSQLNISCKVLNKLELIEDIDHLIDKVTENTMMLLDKGMEVDPDGFAAYMSRRISDNIKDFTTLTKEVRENNRFLAELQSKIYDFSLLQEFIILFIDKFKREDPDTTLKVLREIKADNRMRRIIESSEGDGRT